MDMPVNHFKQRLLTGETQYGLFSGLADSVVTEICAGAGFDWLLLDVEHAPNDLRTVLHQLQAAAAYDASMIVRPQTGDRVIIKKLLDIGAQTLLVPMVESGQQARELVEAIRYPPAGVRGVGTGLARAARWNRVESYVARADDEMCLVTQIETLEGVKNIEEIAAIEGVDALFVGPSDLAASMGLIGQQAVAEVREAVDSALKRIVAAGKPAGVFATTPESAEHAISSGASFVAVGSDTTTLATATAELANRFRAIG